MSRVPKQKILEILNDSRLELTGFHFSDEMIRQFQEFYALLLKWNDKINLVSQGDAASIMEKHVYDSLQYLRWLDSGCRVLDIGSGAGFPGIPVKILQPDLELAVMDSQRKRCNFLREVIRSLGLQKISVLDGRAEDFASPSGLKGQFDRVLFRGFGSLETCLTLGASFLKPKGKIILMKNPDEIADFPGNSPHKVRIIETRSVSGFYGRDSLMMVFEKCST